mmetsp:Transcript_39274/g.50742  ORF Transcript_39274/g.50742 Transcript_39274/m.50742 type:complete len:357 (+) Transcript_39274:1218-2288(+)
MAKMYKDHFLMLHYYQGSSKPARPTSASSGRGFVLPASPSGISDDLLVNVAFGWGIGGKDMDSLVDSLTKANLLKHEKAIAAMKQVDRAWFIPQDSPIGPYENRPHLFPLKRSPPHAEVAISTPQMHSQVMEAIAPAVKEGARCLDVGCGSGYILAVLRVLAGRKGSALGVDLYPEVIEDIAPKSLQQAKLYDKSIKLLAGNINLTEDQKRIEVEGQFEVIHFGAAALSRDSIQSILSKILSPGGRMVCPVVSNGQEQRLVQFDKDPYEDKIEETVLGTVMCAPLTEITDVEEHSSTDNTSFHERLDKVKKDLSDWKTEFELQNGRAPSREDLFSNPQSKVLFEEFSMLNRRIWQK